MDILAIKEAFEWFLLRACFASLAGLVTLFILLKVGSLSERIKIHVKRHGWPVVILFFIWSAWATYTSFPTSEEKREYQEQQRQQEALNKAWGDALLGGLNGNAGSSFTQEDFLNSTSTSNSSVTQTDGSNTTGEDSSTTEDENDSSANRLTSEDFARGFVLTQIGFGETHDFTPKANAIIQDDWLDNGAATVWFYPEINDWYFALGTNDVDRVRVHASAQVDPLPTEENFYFSPFKTSLGIVPEANWSLLNENNRPSCFWHEHTPSNTLLLTWQNALYNRATNMPISIQMEVEPSGSFIYRYDLSKANLWSDTFPTNILVGTFNEPLHQTVDISTLTNLTSLTFKRLDQDDIPGSDRDNDGLTIEEELFVYHTNPNFWDSDYDGIGDGVEVINGSNPAIRDSDGDTLVDGSDPNPILSDSLLDLDGDGIADVYENHWFGGTNVHDTLDFRDETGFSLLEKIKGGINPTNEASSVAIISADSLYSWKLFDGISLDRSNATTNLIWERSFSINRTNPWQQYFLSSSPKNAASWYMTGMELEWETDAGEKGILAASPFNDSFRLPLSTNNFSSVLTLRLRSKGSTISHTPTPLYLLAYSPRFTVDGGKTIIGESGRTFSLFLKGTKSNVSLKIDDSLHPCKAPPSNEEYDLDGLKQLFEDNVDFSYMGDERGGSIIVNRPGVIDLPEISIGLGSSATYRRTRSGCSGSSIVVLDPLASYGCNGHGCSYDGVGYDWGSDEYYEEDSYPLNSKCLRRSWGRDWGGGYHDYDCEVTVSTGEGGGSGYVTTEVNGGTGKVFVDGVLVWSDTPIHSYDDTGCGGGYHEDYLGDGCNTCESDCANGNCDSHEGSELGSLKFRIPLGSPTKGQISGFVWFSYDWPFVVNKRIFSLEEHPSSSITHTNPHYGTRRIICNDSRGRDVRIADIASGVRIDIYETASQKLEHSWEITNVNGSDEEIRLRKISRLNNIMSDETYTYIDGDWRRFDNIAGVGTDLTVEYNTPSDGDWIKRETRVTRGANDNELSWVAVEQSLIGEFDKAVMRETYREERMWNDWKWTRAEYWNDPSLPARHGQPRLITGNTRGWVYTDFDENGRETLRIEQRGTSQVPSFFPTVTSNELNHVSGLENAFVIVNDYVPLIGDGNHNDDLKKVRTETRYVAQNGNLTLISRTWHRYTRLNCNGYAAIKKETFRAATQIASFTDSANAYSYEITYADTGLGTPLLMRNAVAEALDENGVLTENAYSLSGNVLSCETRKSYNGNMYRTYTLIEQDATYGNILRRAEYLTANDTLIGNEVSTYDEKNRLRSTTYFDGAYITNAYSCCRLLWRQDREGRKTLRSAKTGEDHLYFAEEDVWLSQVSTNGQYRVTQHFFDAIGRETNTVVYVGSTPSEAIEKSASNGKRYSATKTEYPYGGSDYAVSTDERGKVTISRTDIQLDAMETGEIVFTNGLEVIKTKSRTYFGGGSSVRREWGGDKWTEERRFTDYADDGKRIDYVVTDSYDCGIVTNFVSIYDLLGRVVSVSVPGANSSRIVTETSYHGSSIKKILETITGSLPIQYRYNVRGELWEKQQGASLIRNESLYETISGEVFNVAMNLRMTGSTTNSVQIRKQQLTGLSNDLLRRVISISSGRTTIEERTFNPETGLRTDTYRTESMLPTVSVSRHGVEIEQTSLDQKVEMLYDAFGRQIETRSLDIESNTLTKQENAFYDVSGNIIATRVDLLDGRVGETTTEYDTLNQEVRKVDAIGNETIITYDPLGRIIAYNGDTYPLKSLYDSQGRKTSGLTTRDSGSTRDETKWEFDAASGLNTAKVYADGTRISYDYTNNGKKTRTTWARGAWKQNSYNERNLVSATTYSDANTPTITYSHSDAVKVTSANMSNGNATSYQYDDRLLNISECISIGKNNYTLARTYDNFRRNERTAVIFTNVSHSSKTRIYDSENRVCAYALTNSFGRGMMVNLYYEGSYQSSMEYKLPNGNTFTVELHRELARRALVTNRRYLYGQEQMYSYSTDYDLIERPVNATDSLSNHREWLYNKLNELSSAIIGTNTYSYAYDSIGNRQWSVVNSATNSYQANALNQYSQVDSANLAYDADGNLLQDEKYVYTYDAENRLISVRPINPTSGNLAIRNEYNHKSLRVRKIVERFENGLWENDRTHEFIWDGTNLILERIAFTNGELVTKEYFWGIDKSGTEQGAGGVGGLLAVSINGVLSIPCYDHNGNIVAYVSETGSIEALYVYDAYGNTIDQSGEKANAHSFGFSTKYHDREVGLIGYQKRFYRPDYGRWLNRDPIEEEGGENLYAFCGNNPILYYDINGESFWGYFSDGVKMLAGTLSFIAGAKLTLVTGGVGGVLGGAALMAYGADQIHNAYENMKSRYEQRSLPTGTFIQQKYRSLSYTLTGKHGSTMESVLDYSYTAFELIAACATGWASVTRTTSVINQVKPLQTVGRWTATETRVKMIRYEFSIEGGVSGTTAAGVAIVETFNIAINVIGLMPSPEENTDINTPFLNDVER